LLGPIDKQGLRIRSFNVHPDESSMLLSMFSDDGVALGVWDVYLYQLDGQRIDRVTAFDQGYSGTWSPDGRHIFFKAGSESGANCNPALGCPETCSSHYVSSSARSIRLADAQTLELGKVPCYSEIMWRA
jgi:Tol biopolymer transport system component